MNNELKKALEAARNDLAAWQIREQNPPKALQTGQVYRLAGGGKSGLFTILEIGDHTNGDTLVCAAMSPVVNRACSWDIVVPSAQSPFGASCIVEIWNRVTIAFTNSPGVYLGTLPQQYAVGAMELYISWLDKEAGDSDAFAHLVGTELEAPDERGEFHKSEVCRVQELVNALEQDDSPIAYANTQFSKMTDEELDALLELNADDIIEHFEKFGEFSYAGVSHDVLAGFAVRAAGAVTLDTLQLGELEEMYDNLVSNAAANHYKLLAVVLAMLKIAPNDQSALAKLRYLLNRQ